MERFYHSVTLDVDKFVPTVSKDVRQKQYASEKEKQLLRRNVALTVVYAFVFVPITQKKPSLTIWKC